MSRSGVPGVQAAWIELGPGTTVIARAVTTATVCPTLTVDGGPFAMTVHAAASTEFNITVCDAVLPAHVASAQLGAQNFVLPKPMPARIVVIGDTGCRIKGYGGTYQLQDCNSPDDWPFAKISQSVANSHPDLIIFVGDYHYREAVCPAGRSECVGAAIGDNWPSWQQDLIQPGLPLLEAAPLILVRGNHELCSRGGHGWFTLLDPRPMPSTCVDATPSYWTTVGDHQIAVVDSASDQNMQPSFDAMQPMPNSLVWWVLHRPFLTPGGDDEISGAPAALPSRWQAPGLLNAVFAGHQHRLAYNQFPSKTWPPEFINGNGASQLDDPPNSQNALQVTAGKYTAIEWFHFGFSYLDRQSGGWAMTSVDENGSPVISCHFTEAVGVKSALSCQPLPAASQPPPGGTAVAPKGTFEAPTTAPPAGT